MSIPSIVGEASALRNRTTIERNATTQSFTRGESYYQAEAVAALTQRGNMLQAELEGSEPMPYSLTQEILPLLVAPFSTPLTNSHFS
jgi:uncharacterized Zn finger protein